MTWYEIIGLCGGAGGIGVAIWTLINLRSKMSIEQANAKKADAEADALIQDNYEKMINAMQRRIEALELKVESLELKLGNKDREIGDMLAELQQKDCMIAAQERIITDKDHLIAKQAAELDYYKEIAANSLKLGQQDNI